MLSWFHKTAFRRKISLYINSIVYIHNSRFPYLLFKAECWTLKKKCLFLFHVLNVRPNKITNSHNAFRKFLVTYPIIRCSDFIYTIEIDVTKKLLELVNTIQEMANNLPLLILITYIYIYNIVYMIHIYICI